MGRPPADSPDRRRRDAALAQAQRDCPPEHRGSVPEVPCGACITAADREYGNLPKPD